MSDFDLKDYLSARQDLINRYLMERVPAAVPPVPELYEAMNYSLAAGGKRVRPILAMASWEACRGQGSELKYPADILAAACTLEMIHTYSLIHDDLPAMDDDDLRRGKPTSHKVFGEALAILAGDALLTEAFASLAEVKSDHPERVLRVIAKIAEASGARGMAGGQVLDLQAENKKISEEELEKLHRHKTGRLLHVSCIVGAELASATSEQYQALNIYGQNVGLAFQIEDDVLDVEGGTEALGKMTGADAAHGKNTYPSVLGLEASKTKARALIADAVAALGPLGTAAEPLEAIAHYIISRNS